MKIKNVLFYTLFCLCLTVSLAEAKSFSIVADVESMQWFKEQGSPLLKSAGVEDKIHYRIINSSEINAFVTPDKNINFFNGSDFWIFSINPDQRLTRFFHIRTEC